jgi:hypothetical protein
MEREAYRCGISINKMANGSGEHRLVVREPRKLLVKIASHHLIEELVSRNIETIGREEIEELVKNNKTGE